MLFSRSPPAQNFQLHDFVTGIGVVHACVRILGSGSLHFGGAKSQSVQPEF